jgi:uncharacterized membrane protein YeaQ/YmgE (transglycosylase-associated protein family)
MEALIGNGGVGLLGTALIGIVGGWIAEQITRSDHGILTNLIVGVVGSWIGFAISNAMGIQIAEFFSGWFWGNALVSAAGATLLLGVLRMFKGRRAAQ